MTKEKSLVKVNETNIFHRLKNFFMNFFKKKKDIVVEEETSTIIKQEPVKSESSFIESIKNMSSEEIALLELQKKYKSGEIAEEEMTEEQVDALCDLYDRQNEELRRSNEYRKQKILEYRNSKRVS